MQNHPARPSLHELLLRSDFGRADPDRARALLDAAIEDRTGGRVIDEVEREDVTQRQLEAA